MSSISARISLSSLSTFFRSRRLAALGRCEVRSPSLSPMSIRSSSASSEQRKVPHPPPASSSEGPSVFYCVPTERLFRQIGPGVRGGVNRSVSRRRRLVSSPQHITPIHHLLSTYVPLWRDVAGTSMNQSPSNTTGAMPCNSTRMSSDRARISPSAQGCSRLPSISRHARRLPVITIFVSVMFGSTIRAD